MLGDVKKAVCFRLCNLLAFN